MKLKDLAKELNLNFTGDGDYEIHKVAPLDKLGKGELSFFMDPKYKTHLEQATDGVVILNEKHQELCHTHSLVSSNPYASYAKATQLLYPVTHRQGIDSTAVVESSATVHESAYIAAHCYIGANVTIGANSQIGPGSFVGDNATIGNDCYFHARVSVYHDCVVGNHVLIHSGTVVGCDGFGFANEDGRWIKIPQVGRVVIEDHVEIGSNTAIDRGALGDTIIHENVILDNLVHIAHNCTIGSGTALAAQCGMAGSTNIGKNVLAGGQCGFAGHIDVADGSQFNGKSIVTKTITETSQAWGCGLPVEKVRDWRRSVVRIRQLEQLESRVKELEKQLKEVD